MRSGATDRPQDAEPPRSAVRPAPGRVIAVFSPCGGVGTTLTAVNVAACAVKDVAEAVALVELRPAPGELAALLRARPLYTLDEVCRHWTRLDRRMLESAMFRHSRGFDVLCQGGYPAEGGIPHARLSPPVVRDIIALLRRLYALSVVELDRTLTIRQIEAMRAADTVLLLARPDALSIRRVRWAVKTAEAMQVPHRRFTLILARSGRRDQMAVKTIERVLRLAVVAQIPEAPQAAGRAVNGGRGLIEGPGAARLAGCLKRLARSLAGEIPVREGSRSEIPGKPLHPGRQAG